MLAGGLAFLTLLGFIAFLGWWQVQRLVSIQGQLATMQSDVAKLNNRPTPLPAAPARFDVLPAKQTEQRFALLRQDVTNMSADARDGLNRLDRSLTGVAKQLQTTTQAHTKQLKELKDESVASLAAGLAGLQKAHASGLDQIHGRLAQMEGRVDRLTAALALPPEESLPSVLFLVDLGERMADYDYGSVQQALARVISAAVRQTPTRKVGLLGNRGDQTRSLLRLDAHPGAADLAELQKRFEENKPTPGEGAGWRVGLEGGVNLLAPRDGRHRLVYVTCKPLRDPGMKPGDWDTLAQHAKEYNIEIWVIQLLRAGDEPEAGLARLATDGGGQYLAIGSGKAGSTGPGRRLVMAMSQTLDLPTPVGGRPPDSVSE